MTELVSFGAELAVEVRSSEGKRIGRRRNVELELRELG